MGQQQKVEAMRMHANGRRIGDEVTQTIRAYDLLRRSHANDTASF
jgi:hypothetical protein